MDSGVPGAPGVAVPRPVERVRRPGLGNVILLLQLTEEITVKYITGIVLSPLGASTIPVLVRYLKY